VGGRQREDLARLVGVGDGLDEHRGIDVVLRRLVTQLVEGDVARDRRHRLRVHPGLGMTRQVPEVVVGVDPAGRHPDPAPIEPAAPA
jgi:hypothetical protein